MSVDKIIKTIRKLPKEWKFTSVNGDKRPITKGWQKKALTLRQIRSDIASGNAKGIGLLTGELSEGLIAVDLDGMSAIKYVKEKYNSLPKTVCWTSGRKGRRQLLFQMPKVYWPKLKNRQVIKTDVGKDEQVEFRWNGCQSVLPPSHHPETGQYRWIRAPWDCDVAEAPVWVIDALMKKKKKIKRERKRISDDNGLDGLRDLEGDSKTALSCLKALHPDRADNYDEWICVGMMLHSVEPGDEMLEVWEKWSESSEKYEEGKCEGKWKTFGDGGGNLTLGSLVMMAREDGWEGEIDEEKKRPSDDVVREIGGIDENLLSSDFVKRFRPELVQATMTEMEDYLVAAKDTFGYSQKQVTAIKREVGSLKKKKGEEKKETFDPFEFAKEYLKEREFENDGVLKLRYFRQDFYRYTGTKYDRLSEANQHIDVVRWLQKGHPGKARNSIANEILLNLKTICHLPDSHDFPAWIGDPKKDGRYFIPMENGILDVKKLLEGKKRILTPHNPDFFSIICLPYPYDRNAKKPHKWYRMLRTNMPSKAMRNLLYEWLGYNLLPDARFEKFAIFTGSGSNGKSVICSVLGYLLGDENTSAVGLESFNVNRPYALYDTLGKLANIAGEMGEIDKAAEGLLKAMVSGDDIPLERKFKDPIKAKPTATLTFCTNNLPRFSDKTNGLWRRMIVFPFDVEIPEAQQNRELKTPAYWQDELPGIFNIAIRALKRLLKRNRFREVKASEEVKDQYRLTSNSAMMFLNDYIEADSSGEISTNYLYGRYSNWCKQNGFRPLATVQFSREVRKVFPGSEASKNPLRRGGFRTRVWFGLKWIDKKDEQGECEPY